LRDALGVYGGDLAYADTGWDLACPAGLSIVPPANEAGTANPSRT
jgi:hypothetical protein